MSVRKITSIYVPLMNTLSDDSNIKLEDVVTELCSLSNKIDINLSNGENILLAIEQVADEEVKKIFRRRKERSFTKRFLKFTTVLNFINKQQVEDLLTSISHETETFVKYLLIYSNIAKPGAIDSREGLVIEHLYYGKKSKITKSSFPMLCNSIDISLDTAKKYNWPKIESLDIEKTILWLKKHWDAFSSVPNNRIQRALNAFSHLFHDSLFYDSSVDLFYAMLGIEALYVDGNIAVQKQVDTKSQLFLGTRLERKKAFNELYDFRSRFIHGQLNFTNKYFMEFEDSAQRHLSKTFDSASFAIAILIASIQKHMIQDKDELIFEIRLKE